MALKNTVDVKGVRVTDAYCKIDSIEGSKNRGFTITVGIYASETETRPIDRKFIKMPYSEYSTTNILAEAYTYIRTLKGWTTAQEI